jgi:colanic acid/amylovoran biosynthesis glycosyltransferase
MILFFYPKHGGNLMERKLNICIISPDKDVYSETFIRTHVHHLPGNIHFLYGGDLPLFFGNGQKLIQRFGLVHRILLSIDRKIRGRKPSEERLRRKILKKYLIKHRIDAVLAEYGPTGCSVKDVCRDSNIPLIVHFHGYDAYEHETLRRFNNYRELFTMASGIIVVSRNMRKQLLNLGAPADKLFHIVYGVDPKEFNDAKPELNPPVFLFVGRFVDKKAPHLTVLAFRDVINFIPNARLIMIGDGPLLEACKQLVKALNISDSVEFMGRRSHQEVADVMKNARGLIQHSLKTNLGDSEGTPLAILEAGASGIPVVSTRHAGIPDVVIEGKTGFLVNEGDVIAMADAVIKLCKDESLAGYMGKIGKDYIVRNFSVDKSIHQLYQVIRSIVKKEKVNAGLQGAKPLVSVVIPIFNREKQIVQALKSIQNQTYSNWEAIVVDDASQDQTMAVLREAASSDPRIQFIQHKYNKGAQAARNTGIRAAKGEWIAFLDSDDQWLPDSLESRMELLLKEHSNVVYSYSYIVQKDKPMQMYYVPAYWGSVYKDVLKKDGPTFQSLIVKKTALEQIGYLDEKIVAFQEWDTAIRLAEHNKFSFLPKPTFIYDYTCEDSISRDSIRGAKGYGQILRKHFWKMLWHGGVGTIGYHYSIIANWYKTGGNEDLFKKYRLKSIGWKIASPYIVLNKLKSMVTNNEK